MLTLASRPQADSGVVCPAVEFHWNVFQIRNVVGVGWQGWAPTLHWELMVEVMVEVAGAPENSHCNNGRCHLACPALIVAITLQSLQPRSGPAVKTKHNWKSLESETWGICVRQLSNQYGKHLITGEEKQGQEVIILIQGTPSGCLSLSPPFYLFIYLFNNLHDQLRITGIKCRPQVCTRLIGRSLAA